MSRRFSGCKFKIVYCAYSPARVLPKATNMTSKEKVLSKIKDSEVNGEGQIKIQLLHTWIEELHGSLKITFQLRHCQWGQECWRSNNVCGWCSSLAAVEYGRNTSANCWCTESNLSCSWASENNSHEPYSSRHGSLKRLIIGLQGLSFTTRELVCILNPPLPSSYGWLSLMVQR